MSSAFDLIDLSRQLKQERLFVNCEREQLHQLNHEVSQTAETLYRLSWITRKQKANLNDLVRAAKDVTPVTCCQRSNSLERVRFVDGYKYLTYHESKIGECLKTLKGNPELVATVLVQAEKQGTQELQHMAQILMSGIYGNTVMQEDEILILQVLRALIKLQILPSDNPRKLLRKESCAFSRFFKLLIEGLFSAKLFLTAALHKPVMQLLMEDEWFYDIDPEKALHRFPPGERVRRFGTPDSSDYASKVKQYREITNKKLVMIAERFILSIKNNMYCFPQSLGWIISQLYAILSQNTSAGEAKAVCADLVLALFICPAICDPEPYGITTDAPISYIARHNLMQVAQILQVLAISTLDAVDNRQRDVYGKFEKDCMGFLLSSLLTTQSTDLPPQMTSRQQLSVERTAMYLTMSEITRMVSFLRDIVSSLEDDSSEKLLLLDILSKLPSSEKLEELTKGRSQNTTPNATPPGTPSSSKKIRGKGDRSMRLKVFLTPDRTDRNEDSQSDQEGSEIEPEEVVVVSLGVVNECPGMESEQKVLELENQKKSRHNSVIPGEDDPISESEINANEKRTRFSLSHDQDSIATSDNLEAISEAASSHSVGSDIENDNLSDMVSANVSGRGTPSISGRDTPLSQTTEMDSQFSQIEGQVEERRETGPNLPVTVQKNNREDVTDKFQKFDIKTELERDDIKSTVSDTWSTDVLASDSEPPEQNQLERLEEIAEEMARQNLLGVQIQEVSENLETASDAWSTDVLASDTSELQVERLRELEQEEVSSISSRSQLQDFSADDPGGASEDTPQPSSPHSTCSDGRRPSEELGAMGGDDNSDIYNPEEDVDVFSFQEPQSRNVTNQKQFEVNTVEPPLSEQVERFTQPGLTAGSRPPQKHKVKAKKYNLDVKKNDFRHSARGAFRELDQPDLTSTGDNLLSSFDPVSHNPSVSATTNHKKPTTTTSATSLIDGSNNNKTQKSDTEVGGASLLPPPVAPVNAWDCTSGDSGLISMESSTNSVDSVSSQLSGGLKLTEQQNPNIDAHRLSAGMTVFDPLSQGGSDGSAGDRSESSSGAEGSGTPEHVYIQPQHSSNSTNRGGKEQSNREVYDKQGARPKLVLPPSNVGGGGQFVNPKIQLQVNDRNIKKDLDGTGGGVEGGLSGGPAVRFTSDVGQEESEVTIEGTGHDNTNTKGKVNGEVVVSVESDGKFDGGERKKSGEETGSGRKGEEESFDKNQEKKKANQSFFRTFKDKISKGNLASFQVGVTNMYKGAGNKKRVSSKPASDREEGVKAVSSVRVDTGGAGEPSGTAKGSVPRNESCDDILNKYRTPGSKQAEEGGLIESSDDILEKYRKQAANSPMRVQENGSGQSSDATSKSKGKDVTDGERQELPPAYDPTNLEGCKAFKDAKKKLRLVLSTADFQAIPLSSSPSSSILGVGPAPSLNDRKENELVGFLKAQLAEAINLQDKDLIAQLHETIRCLSVFTNYEIKKLLKSIKESHRSRSPYTTYLISCRQGLLGTQAHLERLLNRVQRDKTVMNKYFLAVCVRMFLEKREHSVHRFIQDFQKLTLSDEKTKLVEDFLARLHRDMDRDPVWQVAKREQLEDSKLFIERYVMSHIYGYAMYPNGDGDVLRDQILHEHMKHLSQIITPSHQDLRIPKMYHYECPWPAAQNEIYMINAYKTPKDKLQCVLRCSSTIMNLLSLANEKSVPAADDFMPVLIFVLIKANPPSLLSTVQYVNSFYEKRLQGEEHYWWMQFTSAIAFIKTMDYTQ